MHQPEEYKAVRAWNSMLGAREYYIILQQEKAAAEGAPLDAIFKDHDSGRWHTIDNVKDAERREWLRQQSK